MFDVPERYNACCLLDANLELGRSGSVAITCEGERLTWQDLHDRASALGRALRALGLRREDRIILILDDTPAFAVAFWGTLRAGIVPVPINPISASMTIRFSSRIRTLAP